MKVLLVAPIRVPHANMETYVVNGLRAAGMEVVRYGYNEMQESGESARITRAEPVWKRRVRYLGRKWLPDWMFRLREKPRLKVLLNTIKNSRPDLLMIFSKQISAWAVDDLRKKFPGLPLAGFAWDDPQDFSGSGKVSRHYDVFFTDDHWSMHKHREAGADCHWFPFAADPEINGRIEIAGPEKMKYSSDVVFIGTAYGERLPLLRAVKEHGLAIWGPEQGMPDEARDLHPLYHGPASALEVRKIYSSSKILINPHRDFGNPVERGSWVNLRTFEAACCGIFQLTDYKEDLDRLFDVGIEIVTFSDEKDLREKVRYYLDHPEEREQIAARARQKTLSSHLYIHRIQKVMEILEDRFPGLRKPQDRNY